MQAARTLPQHSTSLPSASLAVIRSTWMQHVHPLRSSLLEGAPWFSYHGQVACGALAAITRGCCSTNSSSPAASSHIHSLRAHPYQQTRGVRCYSTPGLSPPSGAPQHISWLQEVQVWSPSAPATTDSLSSSSSSSSGNNGSSTNNTTSSSDSSSSNGSTSGSTSGYHEPRFKRISEADLQQRSSSFDAIVVLAGGLTLDGGLPEWVHRRMDVARDLHILQGRRPAIVCSGGGTPHKPAVIAANGHVIYESTSGAAYLMATGVQPEAIYKEVSSFDTVGNAYFSLCIHTIPASWRDVAIVTSDFHMPRSRALFADIFCLAGQSLHGDPSWYSLTFLSASDDGVFDHHVYNARLGKEAGSLAHWQQVAAGLEDWAAFHRWFFADHLCYAVQRQHEFGKRTIKDQRLLDSY